MYFLHVESLDGDRRVLRLRDGVVTIGRCETRTVVLTGDDVSRFHAEISVSGPQVSVRDVGSSNGTFVRGRAASWSERVLDSLPFVGSGRRLGRDESVSLEPGEAIRIGQWLLTIAASADLSDESALLSASSGSGRGWPGDEIVPAEPSELDGPTAIVMPEARTDGAREPRAPLSPPRSEEPPQADADTGASGARPSPSGETEDELP